MSKIIKRKKSRGMSWAKHLALIGQGRIAYIVLEKKEKKNAKKRPTAVPRHRWENTEMGHNETDWIIWLF